MINACPGGPEWNKLVKAVGEFEAYRDYIENGETIRDPKVVLAEKNFLKSKPVVNSKIADLEKILVEGFLKDFNISVEEYQSIKDDLGIDAFTASDLITKRIVYNEGESILPEVAYFAYMMLGKQNNKIKSELRYLVSKWSKYKERSSFHRAILNKRLGKAKFNDAERKDNVKDRVIIDFLKENLLSYYKNPTDFKKNLDTKWTSEDFTLWEKFIRAIKNWLNINFGIGNEERRADLENLGLAIADEVLTQNYEYYDYGLADDQIRKYYKDTIESDEKAKSIVDVSKSLGLVLTGSLALRRAGTVFRNAEETLHDIDFVVPYEESSNARNMHILDKINMIVPAYVEREDVAGLKGLSQVAKNTMNHVAQFTWFRQFEENFPSFRMTNGFYGKEHTNFESITVQGVIDGEFYDSSGTHEEEYNYYAKDPVTKKPVKQKGTKIVFHEKGEYIKGTGYQVDFFIRLTPFQEEHDNYFKLWKEIMLAKIKMGRDKDFIDWKAFIPYMQSQDNYNFGYAGFRHVNYESSIDYAMEDVSTSETTQEQPLDDMIADMIETTPGLSTYSSKIELTPIETDVRKANGLVQAMVQQLSSRLSVPYEFVTADEARTILENAGKPFTDQAGFYVGGKVYLVAEQLNLETAIHEFSHPFVRAIQQENPELFEKLFNDLSLSAEGQKVLDTTEKLYGKEDPLFKEEAIVRALTRAAKLKMTGALEATENKAFKSLVGRILYAIKQAFRKYFGKRVEVSNLDVDTTIDDLSKMLLSADQIAFDIEAVSQDDVIAEERRVKEEIDTFLNIGNTDSGAIAIKSMISDLTRISREHIDRLVKNRNLKEMAEILKSGYDESDYKSIISNLSQYQKELEDGMLDAAQRLEYETQRATALVNSLYRIKYMSSKMVLHMKELLKEESSPENVKKFYYYNQLVEDWSKIIERIKGEMTREDVVTGPVVDVIGNIESLLNTAKKLDVQMSFEGSITLLKETLQPLTAKVKDYYEKIIAELEKKGAPERLLNRYKEEYKQASLNEGDLREWLSGQRGDTHAISAWLESFMNIQDPVVFGLAKYINDNISEVLVKAQQRQNSILMSLEPMLRNAGLGLKDYEALHKMVTYKEKEPIYDSEGNYVERERHAFLHHLKGWRAEIGKLQDQIREAEKKRVETGDSTETDALRAELNKLLHEQFYNDYDSRVFASEALFTKDEIGKKAYIARQNILNKLRNLDATIKQKTDLYDSEFQAERDLHWQEYAELYAYSYPDGTLKQPGTDDYEITKRLLEHREASREFYEWVPIKGMFQGSLRSYEEQLRVQGITGKEFDEKRNEWIENNTKVKIKPQFWQDVQDLIEQLKVLKGSMPVDMVSQMDLDELFKELNDQMSAFRDEDGQPDALIMSEAKLDRILELDQKIASARASLAAYTGITEEQEEFRKEFARKATEYVESKFDPLSMDMEQYTELYNEFRDLNPDDTAYYDEITDAMGSAEGDPTIKEAVSDILLKLNALRSRTATKQYITKVNSFIKTAADGTGIKPSTLRNRMGVGEFDSTNINTLLDDIPFLESLFAESPEFEKWFSANHQKRTFVYEYGPNKGSEKTSYKRSSAWSVTRPNSEEYYEKTDLYDDAGNVIEQIPGVPTNKFWRRQLKDEYRTKRVTFQEALEMGDVSLATVDEQGRWLPKPDSKYRNDEYYRLKTTNRTQFDLLNNLHLYHQQNQEGLNKNARLGVYLPRFRKDNYESIVSGEAKDKVTSMIKNFKASFTKAADDYEEGYNAENQVTYVTLDMFDSQVSGIPIMGRADLSIEETSEDTIMGMMRYMLSAERQKKLIEINPNVRAIQKVVNDEVGGIKDMLTANKQDYLTRGITNFATRKGRSVRSQVINAMIERELEGKQLVGVTENLAWANKLAGNLMKMSSFAFFAFDAASALKNAFNAQFQSVIAAAGGDNLDLTSLSKGAYWAQFATSQISFEIYKFGPKSLNVQLVEMFDPEATRFDKDAGRKFSESATRTLTRDVANMQWFTNFRSWTQLNSVLQLFGGMMNHQKVNQTINGVSREIAYIDAWEIKDGQLTLKEGIDKSWDVGGKKFLEVRNKVQAANKNLNGSLSKMDQPMANRYLLYRMVAYMKTWFTRQFMSRWGFRGNWKNPGARWDVQANDMTIGYYVQALDTLRRGITTLGADFKYMTPREIAAAKKVMTEMGIILLGAGLIGLLFDYDDDDEDRFAKLRENSGPLPGFLVADSAFEFNASGWLENQALFLGKTTMNELEAMTPMFGYDDYINMLKLDSVAVSSTVVNMGKTLQAITQLLLQDPSARYKRAVGPYEWQQEGEYKTLNYLLKSVGLSGKIIDPVNALKNFESAQNRFK
jgi:hypothetical protein